MGTFYMTCFDCGKETLAPGEIHRAGARNGETFTVAVAGYRCANCGFETVDSAQSSEFTQLVSDAYRTAHGLLTSVEIRERRARLGMSQQEFADYLGVGVASVKRWESGKIQEKAMDELMRLKTDLAAARRNLESLAANEYVVSAGVMGNERVELFLRLDNQQYGRGSHMRLDPSNLWASVEEPLDLRAA